MVEQSDEKNQLRQWAKCYTQNPGYRIKRLGVVLVLFTLMYGQITILSELGALERASSLYEIVVWLLLVYGFWPYLVIIVNKLGVWIFPDKLQTETEQEASE